MALAAEYNPHKKTLLSLVLRLRNLDLIKAVLHAQALCTEGCHWRQSLPDHDADSFIEALGLFPQEVHVAMAGLWNLAKGPDRHVRQSLQGRDRLVRGGAYGFEWVWGGGHVDDEPVVPRRWRWGCCRKRPVLPLTASPAVASGKATDEKEDEKEKEAVATPHSESAAPAAKATAKGNTTDPFVTSLMVPIPGACRMGTQSFLACCVKLAEVLGTTAVFEKPIVDVILEYKWEAYARRLFLTFGAISVALAINFSVFTYYAPSLSSIQRLIWMGVVLVNSMPNIFQEVLQVKREPGHYLSSLWNCTDAFTYLLLLLDLVMWWELPSSSATYVVSGSVALLLWVKLLFYFRGFKTTGILVRTVLQITADIRYFLTILVVCMVGFGNAFYIIAQVDLHGYSDPTSTSCADGDSMACLNDAFGTYYETLCSLFSAMTGSYDLTVFDASSVSVLPTILYFAYIIVQMVIMLNLLIAIMGDSFARVSSNALGEWRREQALIILEMEQVSRTVTLFLCSEGHESILRDFLLAHGSGA